jgi:hypothetical protein
MSWGAQNRPKDAKTPSAGRGMSEKPELDLWPVQQYGLIRARKGLLFKLSCPPHECALPLRFIDFHAIDAGNEHAQRDIGIKASRWVYSMSCDDAPVGR